MTRIGRVGLVGLVGLLCLVGCASFEGAAGKLIGSSALTVDAAVKGWEAYVAANSNNVPLLNEIKVVGALERFYLAQDAAVAGYEAAVKTGDRQVWRQAAAGLSASQAEILRLIAEFQRPNGTNGTNGSDGKP